MSDRVKITGKIPETKSENSSSHVKRSNLSKSKASPISQIRFLQGTVGNRAVEGLLESGVIQESMRDFFEPRFGQDFNQVRVHTVVQRLQE